MNLIQEAIEHDKFCEFLLGREHYFVLDRDRGCHDYSYTYNILENYLKNSVSLIERDKLFKLINKCYLKILRRENVNTSELNSIIGFIKIYFFWQEDDYLKEEWIISKELKEEIRLKLNELSQDNSYYVESINDNLKILKDRFSFQIC